MKKFFYGLMFLLVSSAVSAQYMTPVEAIETLEIQATGLENGTVNAKNDTALAAVVNNPNTVTGTSGTQQIKGSWLISVGYPQVLRQLSAEIAQTQDVTQGLQNLESIMIANATDQGQKEILDAALAYATDLITI